MWLRSSGVLFAGWLSTGHELAPEDEGGSLSRKHSVLRARVLRWKDFLSEKTLSFQLIQLVSGVFVVVIVILVFFIRFNQIH